MEMPKEIESVEVVHNAENHTCVIIKCYGQVYTLVEDKVLGASRDIRHYSVGIHDTRNRVVFFEHEQDKQEETSFSELRYNKEKLKELDTIKKAFSIIKGEE